MDSPKPQPSEKTTQKTIRAKKRSMRLQRIIQYYRLRLLTIQATPRQIALGCAVGIFAAFLPILPFQIILGVFLAYMLGASKSAAAIGTLVSSPLNTIPLHMLYYQIGKQLMPFPVPNFSFSQIEMADFWDVGWKLYATLGAGAFCLAVPSTIIGYFIVLKGVETYRKRRKRKMEQRALQARAQAKEKSPPSQP